MPRVPYPAFLGITAALLLGGCAATTAGSPQGASSKIHSALAERGDGNLKKGQYAQAINNFQAALQLNPDDDDARIGIADAYLKHGNMAEAETNYQKLLDKPDYRARALQGIGLLAIQQGDIDAAREALHLSVMGDSSLWRAWNALAQIHDRNNEWEEARHAYESALETTTQPEAIYNNMGVSYMAQALFEDAADSFQKALRYDPHLEIAATNHKLALAMQDRYDEAGAGDNIENEAQSLNNAGYAAMLKGDYDKAERLFVKAIEINPSFYKTPYQNLQTLNSLRQKN